MLSFTQFSNITSPTKKEKLIKQFGIPDFLIEKEEKNKSYLVFVHKKEVINGKNTTIPYCYFYYSVNRNIPFKYFFNNEINSTLAYINNIIFLIDEREEEDIEKIIANTRRISNKENILVSLLNHKVNEDDGLEYKFINYKIPINKLNNIEISKSEIDFEYLKKHIVYAKINNDKLILFINNSDINITIDKIANYIYKLNKNLKEISIYTNKFILGISDSYISDYSVYQEYNDYIKHKKSCKRSEILIDRINFTYFNKSKINSVYKKLNTNISKKDIIDNNKYIVYLFERNDAVIGNMIFNLTDKEIYEPICDDKDRDKIMEKWNNIKDDIMETKEITGMYKLW